MFLSVKQVYHKIAICVKCFLQKMQIVISDIREFVDSNKNNVSDFKHGLRYELFYRYVRFRGECFAGGCNASRNYDIIAL